jgi:HD superfamily phosphohydrolase YqeK
MLVYCADKLEPARTKKDVSNREGYVKLAKTNLKKSFDKLYKETNSHYH